jgi:phage anti-repressor protein
MNELIKVQKNDDGRQVVSARELHDFLEVGSRFNDWFNNMLKYGFEENIDYTSFTKNLVSGGKTKEYALTLDMAKELSMIQRSDKGKQARKYFIDCEKKLNRPRTALELAKEQVLLLEDLERTQKELDIAIKTKAEIGSKREATAMATASAQTRRANKLEEELDKSKEYCSIKRMQMLNHGIRFNWRLLKSNGIEMGIKPIDIFDANYGTIKAYHKDVWKETYNLNF